MNSFQLVWGLIRSDGSELKSWSTLSRCRKVYYESIGKNKKKRKSDFDDGGRSAKRIKKTSYKYFENERIKKARNLEQILNNFNSDETDLKNFKDAYLELKTFLKQEILPVLERTRN